MKKRDHDQIVAHHRRLHEQEVKRLNIQLDAYRSRINELNGKVYDLENRQALLLNILGDLQARGVIDLPDGILNPQAENE